MPTSLVLPSRLKIDNMDSRFRGIDGDNTDSRFRGNDDFLTRLHGDTTIYAALSFSMTCPTSRS